MRFSRRLRILVIDDEPLMGSAIVRVLSDHDVVSLTSARVALTRVAAGERFDVVLCDVMMPDFSGIDLYRGLTRHAPDLLERLVFITGGAYTNPSIEFLETVPNIRLEKPIWPQALYAVIEEVLAASAPGVSASGGQPFAEGVMHPRANGTGDQIATDAWPTRLLPSR